MRKKKQLNINRVLCEASYPDALELCNSTSSKQVFTWYVTADHKTLDLLADVYWFSKVASGESKTWQKEKESHKTFLQALDYAFFQVSLLQISKVNKYTYDIKHQFIILWAKL